ncbi:hypothetical protein Vi05172_g6490 [Venturia inaequalis]|nr:hypothetical protein Vi05172_g6490 [Venturia inaequalis]
MTPPSPTDIPHVSKTFDPANAEESALDILIAYDVSWAETKAPIEIEKFTGGWTNTLLKATRNLPGKSKAEIEADAVLVRAYGVGTESFIDRESEVRAHCLLAEYGLAPRLLARFENGLLYGFVPGTTCKAADIRKPNVSRAIARELGQWHGRLPLSALVSKPGDNETGLRIREPKRSYARPCPNVWTVMQRWLDDLPVTSVEGEGRHRVLQDELTALCEEFVDVVGLGGREYVFTHGDLHGANVIIRDSVPTRTDYEPSSTNDELAPIVRESSSTDGRGSEDADVKVDFIDYEYCMPAPPAFELAYHFSEWAGFECAYRFIPTRSERRRFIEVYVRAFYEHAKEPEADSDGIENKEADVDRDVRYLEEQVDAFRGVPGMYWALWALMQIHRTGEDQGAFYETKIREYWDWKGERDGSRKESGRERSLRERRWMEE